MLENHVFCITKPFGKVKVILDMKVLNTYISLPRLRMFKLNYCYPACMSKQYACKIDLSNAFWHIGIHESCKRFLSFRFDNTNYVWKVMPFGLRTAPYLFSKLMQPIIKHLRKKYQITIFDYLDD